MREKPAPYRKVDWNKWCDEDDKSELSSEDEDDEGKVPQLSIEAVHELHIFVAALAVTHVVLSALTVVLGFTQINKWQQWSKKVNKRSQLLMMMLTAIRHMMQFSFIKERFKGFGKAGGLYGWLHSFFKQFYGSLTEEDYATMRLGFINKHCTTNPKFNVYKYMLRALEADFKKFVDISWYLWGPMMLFLFLNVHGWHVYFWISWFPLITLLVVGAKLEPKVVLLAHEVAEKHAAVEGDLLVTPSDNLFWFHQPKIVLVLLHFILFQNAFEIVYFLWIWVSVRGCGCSSCLS